MSKVEAKSSSGSPGIWGFLSAMRFAERHAGKKPRIGQSRRVSQDVVEMGQDPYTSFATNDLSLVDIEAQPPQIRPRFLGFFGPYGPLPSSLTREAERWAKSGDRSFVRFTDIFVVRFQQLFYRSWSDARPITQYDHPTGGEFPRCLRALTGDASTAFDGCGAVDDIVRLRYASLGTGRVRSPVKLRQMLGTHFDVAIRLEEFVPSWLEFSSLDRSIMGVQGMSLGHSMRIGQRSLSIGEKFVVHVECKTLEQYRTFLPGRTKQAELKDLVLGYTGGFYEVDVALWLPRSEIGAAQLGLVTELGWTSAMPICSQPEIKHDAMVRACQYTIEVENISTVEINDGC